MPGNSPLLRGVGVCINNQKLKFIKVVVIILNDVN